MGKFSNDLLNMLSEFMIHEIGSGALDGITYALVLKKDENKINKYMRIRDEADRCGFSYNEVFRVHEVLNGYIFDMDMITAKQITAEITKNMPQFKNGRIQVGELLKDRPDKRRKNDIEALSKYLKSKYDAGELEFEVALFSRNSTNKIMIHGVGANGEKLMIVYRAYAIRHWDIELLNEKFLIPAGFRVKSIRPYEILPSRTGVSFLFCLESLNNFYDRKRMQ